MGRVCVVNYGPDAGKLCTIVDIVDQNKCLVDGPNKLTGMGRQVIPFKRLALTDLVCKIERSAKAEALTAAWEVSLFRNPPRWPRRHEHHPLPFCMPGER